MFFLEGKRIEIIKEKKEKGLVLAETEDFIFLKTDKEVKKIEKKKLIIKIIEKNRIIYIKTEKLPKIKQRIKRLKKYL
ncbi:MAG TPA: hypothetical protein EYH54_00580 [Nautiliaceae bacterium]|nr:hypothetical protein [Nautiliaceae bacterium]